METKNFFHHSSGKSLKTFMFPCGDYKISCGVGTGHYCTPEISEDGFSATSDDVEIAVFDESGEWVTRWAVKGALGEELSDDVLARATKRELDLIMRFLLNQKEAK